MARIVVTTDQLEQHLNNDNVTIESFEWVKHYHQPNFDFSVDDNLEFENPDLVDITELKEVEEQLDKLTIDHTALQSKFDELEQDTSSLKTMFDELTIKYNKLVASKSHSWKFWK